MSYDAADLKTPTGAGLSTDDPAVAVTLPWHLMRGVFSAAIHVLRASGAILRLRAKGGSS